MSKLTKYWLFIIVILIIDQASKFWIKTNMALGDDFTIIHDWFHIHFVENNGMAFGFEFAGEYGKMFLTLFRIVAVTAIGWYMSKICKLKEMPAGYILCIALIFAGAMGNIIDSVFYGKLFSHSHGQIAQFMPDGGGYGTLLHGKVVDLFYFPLINSRYPDWMPWLGGQSFQFFRPVFNVADAAISVGIACMLLFYWKTLNIEMNKSSKKKENDK